MSSSEAAHPVQPCAGQSSMKDGLKTQTDRITIIFKEAMSSLAHEKEAKKDY